ncbi:hypothetical protein [Nocardia wallacei]|uniref:hypothetical protein n=1 Tax=Nocardia wallacei TaxID=480035 RepID=UPI002457247D|nr:hypothetical protein [Nocardia wallacei]
MPRRDPRAPELGQTAMFAELPQLTNAPGRHSTDTDRALRAAGLAESDLAAATLARAGAWALDQFEAQNKPYGPSKTIPAVLDALRALHLTPDSQPEENIDGFDALIRELAANDDAADHDSADASPAVRDEA